MQVTPEQSKWTLVSSNIAYLIPAMTTLYKMYKAELNKQDGSTLVILFAFVALMSSWSYHSCRSDLTEEHIKTDKSAYQPGSEGIPNCATCPPTTMTWVNQLPGSADPMTFEVARLLDHLLAIYTLVIVLIHVVPLKEKVRKLVMIVALLWLILFLSGGNEAAALIPAFLALILLIVFWYCIWNNNDKGFFTRNTCWTFAVILMILAGVSFKIMSTPYWFWHSNWHFTSALACAFLISKTAICYQDVDIWKAEFPPAMWNLFSSPEACR